MQIIKKKIFKIKAISGTGSLRLAAEFLKRFGGAPLVYLPTPTWANHKTIFGAAGLKIAVR